MNTSKIAIKTNFLIILYLLSINLFSQHTYWLNPVLQGQKMNDIAFFDEQTGLACGEWGQIYRTGNGGKNWEMVFNDRINSISEINIIDPQQAFLKKGDGTIIHTSDRGRYWAKSCQIADSFSIQSLQMLNENNGHMVCRNKGTGEYSFWKTQDAAKNWETINNSIFKEGKTIASYSFSDIKNGFLILQDPDEFISSHIYKTNDSGITFQHLSNSYFTDESYRKIYFLKDSSIILISEKVSFKGGSHFPSWHRSNIKHSTDSGYSWTTVLANVEVAYSRIESHNDSILYLFGSCPADGGNGCTNLLIWNSTDYGQSWQTCNSNPQLFSYGYEIPKTLCLGIRDHKHAIALVEGSGKYFFDTESPYCLIETQNRTDWQPVSEYFDSFSSTLFLNKKMYISCASHLLNYTIGSQFNPTEVLKTDGNITKACAYKNEKACWISRKANARSNIYFTKDNGSQFDSIVSNSILMPTDMSFSGAKHVFVFKNWQGYDIPISLYLIDLENKNIQSLEIPVDPESYQVNSMAAMPEALFLFGRDGNKQGYYKSGDMAGSWEFHELELDWARKGFVVNDSLMLIEEVSTDDVTGAVFSRLWKVDHTHNELAEIIYENNTSARIIDVAIDPKGVLYILLKQYDKSWIALTNELGKMAKHCPLPLLDGITADPEEGGWAFGHSGRLLYIGLDNPVYVAPIEHEEEVGFTVIGNPFSDKINIELNKGITKTCTIRLFDASGRKLFESTYSSNNRQITISNPTKSLKAGIYFISIKSGQTQETKRIIKL